MDDVAARYDATWDRSPGVIGWLSQVNHKAIAVRFMVTAFVFYGLAGVAALIMRVQLFQPNQDLISPSIYNQLFTTHGTTMMFLFAIPIVEAVGMYFVPLMIGARDMAFPRLNAFGYYVFLLAGISIWLGMLTGNGPDGAWFNYVPLTSLEFSPGIGIDLWATAITFIEISALVAAIELIVTILKMRAPGMSLNRMPILVWGILVTAFMILIAMPMVMLASVMLALDRLVGTHFFDVAEGGDPLLWQHLFWIFGHPEVYIIFLPGLGIVSSIVVTFARRGLAAYTLVAMSLVAIGFLSFGLWVHHMFTTGLPTLSLSLFAAASMVIAIPSGIQVFSWIATMWGRRPRLHSPMLFILGFFIVFVIGGITGVMVAAIPLNEQVHDTYFVVAHFHYVILGGMLFPIYAAIHYWFPKITGRMMHEGWGKASFWVSLFGFNLAFFPMHFAGFEGMPRQVYTYQAGMGLETPNQLSTIGAFVFALAALMILLNATVSYFRGTRAPANPWGAGTLEWATPSPPPNYNFFHTPQVRRRYALWPDDDGVNGEPLPALDTVDESVMQTDYGKRESPATGILDGRLHHKYVLASPSIFPMLTAISVGIIFLGSVFSLWFVPVGVVLTIIFVVPWLWPSTKEEWQ